MLPLRVRLILVCMLFLSSITLASQVEFTIQYTGKRLFILGEKIPLTGILSNKSSNPYTIKLADDKQYNVVVEVRSPTNRLLESSETYKSNLSQSKPIFYKEISIRAGEAFSFRIDVEDFIHIANPGSYAIQATFYPNFLLTSSNSMPSIDAMPTDSDTKISNSLSLTVLPPPRGELPRGNNTGSALVLDSALRVLQKAQPIPPDEVVRRTITARQTNQWDEFFIYLNLEALLTKSKEKKLVYDSETDEGRRKMIDSFKQELMTQVTDNDIVLLPYFFEIQETKYSGTKGKVTVLEKFQNNQLRIIKEYVYDLQKQNDIWYIVDLSVFNKGLE